MIHLSQDVTNVDHASMKSFFDNFKGLAPNLYEIFVSDKTPTRSPGHNRYYWGVVLRILGNHLGYEPDELHQTMKDEFLKGGTTIRTRAQFQMYLDQIDDIASGQDVFIPPPGQINDAFYIQSIIHPKSI